MATVTGLTAARMLEIEAASVVSGAIIGGDLILTQHDGTQINVGQIQGEQGDPGPTGEQGPPGASSISAIPGEVRLWPGSVLPLEVSYGLWAWADGGVLVVADYPIAAGNISSSWKTFGGASDPGAGNFRKPDLRGLVPAGMDAMPGGSRANRMTRAIAITLAGKTGEETHIVTISETPSHNHGGGSHNHGGGSHGHTQTAHDHGGGAHDHAVGGANQGFSAGGSFGSGSSGYTVGAIDITPSGIIIPSVAPAIAASGSIISSEAPISSQGGGAAHENIQPTVMVPYIVKLDD